MLEANHASSFPPARDGTAREPLDAIWAISPTTLLRIAKFFRPEFIEVRGCVLLPWVFEPDNFEEWWRQLEGRVSEVEAALNNLHL